MSEISLKKNILMSGSFRIIIMVISFVTSVISTRYLGVELKGQYSYLVTLTGFIWMTLDLGLFRSFPYLVRKHPDKIGTLYTWSLTLFLFNLAVLSAVSLSLLSFWSKVLSFHFSPFLVIAFVFVIAFSEWNVQLQSLYLGLNKIFKNSIAQLLNSLAMMVIIAIGYFVFGGMDRLAFMLIAMIAASTLCSIYYLINHPWGEIRENFDFHFILQSYKAGFRVFLSTLFIILLIRFDIVLVKKFLGYRDVGIYSLAAHIIDLLQIASNLVGGLLLVKLSDSEDDIEKWLIMKKLLMAFGVLLLAANLGFAILGRFLIDTLYGVQFTQVYSVYLWLIPASFGLSFGSLFNMYLNSKGFPIISIILPAISLVVNVLLNLLLIPIWGINGAAIATSIAYVLWFIMIVWYEQRCSKRQMLKHLIPTRADWNALWLEGVALFHDTINKLRKTRAKHES